MTLLEGSVITVYTMAERVDYDDEKRFRKEIRTLENDFLVLGCL